MVSPASKICALTIFKAPSQPEMPLGLFSTLSKTGSTKSKLAPPNADPNLLLMKRVSHKKDDSTLRFYTNSVSLRDATPSYSP